MARRRRSAEFAEVARSTAQRIPRILARHGPTRDGTGEGDTADAASEQLAPPALCAAAAGGTMLATDRAGQPQLRVVDPARARKTERSSESLGVNVHQIPGFRRIIEMAIRQGPVSGTDGAAVVTTPAAVILDLLLADAGLIWARLGELVG